MNSLTLRCLAVLLCFSAPARAGSLIGFVDGLTGTSAGGWACVSRGSATVSIAAFAGPVLLGIYPATASRPDVAPYCGGGTQHGFSFAFDPATQALFAGQTQLSLYAVTSGVPLLLLRPSNTAALNPLPLPAGALSGLAPVGTIGVAATGSGGPPMLSLVPRGPLAQWAPLDMVSGKFSAGGGYSAVFRDPSPGATLSDGALLPVFGTITSAQGVTVPLSAPLSLQYAGTTGFAGEALTINAALAQSGNQSGIENQVFTSWLPANTALAALTGTVILGGNDASFDEGLAEVGSAPYDQAQCSAMNGQKIAQVPPISRFWAGILKSNAAGSVSIPVNLALSFPVFGQPGGTCLMTWISAGYPYLLSTVAKYAAMQVALQAELVQVTPAASSSANVVPFGMGGEFTFVGGAGQTSIYVGIMATKPLAVDGIAGTQSAAPVAGAPENSGWLPQPQGNWFVQTSFVYLPASVCAAQHFAAQPTNGMFAVLRNATPAALTIPDAGVQVSQMPMFSSGSQAAQRSAYTAFAPGSLPAGFNGILAAGDCLVAYSTAAIEPGAVIDMENQSTVFLRATE